MNLKRGLSFILIFTAVSLAAGCRPKKAENETPLPAPELFPAAEVCSFPSNTPARTFRNLGNGVWGLSNSDDERSAYECTEANSMVQLYNANGNVVQINYSATGLKDGASMITLNYSASGNGAIPNESTYRNVFTNLAETVSSQALGEPPHELFKRKLSNLNSYSQPGKGSPENFDVGKGFILLTREASSDGLNINISVQFFSDVVLRLKD